MTVSSGYDCLRTLMTQWNAAHEFSYRKKCKLDPRKGVGVSIPPDGEREILPRHNLRAM
jgi:hypothetical protein